MQLEKDIEIEESMSDAVEGGAALAWRLLATLEGGSLLLATSALLVVHTVRKTILRQVQAERNIRRVLVTNTTNLLGRLLKKRLEERGCEVDEVDRSASRSSNGAVNGRSGPIVDAIVVVGAEPKADGLVGMATLVTEDVYDNLKLLESLSCRVRPGGCVAWACAGEAAVVGPAAGAFRDTGAAFDTVLHASLQHVAKVSHCEPIWVGRCEGAERAAQRVVAALLTSDETSHAFRFFVRNAAHRVGECLCRWLKIDN